jgi:uncharacterized membrane protein (DUF106 family)
MPEDKQAQMEAQVRKKPRHIIQSQFLIEVILASVLSVSITLVGVSFWFFFGVFPPGLIILLILEVLGSIAYIAYDLWIVWLTRKHKRELNAEDLREKLNRRKEVY